ncbi:hypothetical protein CRG98_017346 [Punica granatum]|uniref:Uncharacterized protein n=1 Tax=Punica granatum TaxID=22663 RepID=A0A2I0K3I2_PUNGR|nr:hypothetical protein CRG98_017346 [Punica granatum]
MWNHQTELHNSSRPPEQCCKGQSRAWLHLRRSLRRDPVARLVTRTHTQTPARVPARTPHAPILSNTHVPCSSALPHARLCSAHMPVLPDALASTPRAPAPSRAPLTPVCAYARTRPRTSMLSPAPRHLPAHTPRAPAHPSARARAPEYPSSCPVESLDSPTLLRLFPRIPRLEKQLKTGRGNSMRPDLCQGTSRPSSKERGRNPKGLGLVVNVHPSLHRDPGSNPLGATGAPLA